MEWFDRLGSLKEVIGLIIAVIGLITAIVSRKRVVVHVQELAPARSVELPTSTERSTAHSAAAGNANKQATGAGVLGWTIMVMLGAGVVGSGTYLAQPGHLGADHILPQILIVLGGFWGSFCLGLFITELVLGAESLEEKLSDVLAGSPEEALHEIKKSSSIIISGSLVCITLITESLFFGEGKTVTTILQWLSAFIALVLSYGFLFELPKCWIKYRWRRWRSRRV